MTAPMLGPKGPDDWKPKPGWTVCRHFWRERHKAKRLRWTWHPSMGTHLEQQWVWQDHCEFCCLYDTMRAMGETRREARRLAREMADPDNWVEVPPEEVPWVSRNDRPDLLDWPEEGRDP